MTIRHPTTLLFLLAASACSQIFPAARNEPAVTSLQPRVEKTAGRRREGSDVTLPKSADRDRLISTLIPCASADSAAIQPRIVTDCQRIDPKGDILRPQIDTGVGKRP